jgi:hypothetical protein
MLNTPNLQRFRVVVTFTGPARPHDYGALVTYTFMHTGLVFQTAELVLRLIMTAFTAVFTVYYTLQLLCGPETYSELLPEQVWRCGPMRIFIYDRHDGGLVLTG